MPLMLRLACAATLLAAGSAANAQALFVESVLATPTVYLSPTAYSVPTSFYTPTSFVTPTAFASPLATTYSLTPTAYYAPSVYETSVVRRGLFGRRSFVETRFVDSAFTPTSFVTPTTFVTPSSFVVPTSTILAAPTMATTSICNEPAQVSTGLPTTEPSPTTSSGRYAAPLTSTPEASEGRRTRQSAPQPPEPKLQDNAPLRTNEPLDSNPPPADTPPPLQIPPQSRPADPADLGGPGPESPRVVQKPVPPEFGILRGKVVSGLGQEPQEGVMVVIENSADPAKFTKRTGVTDADGQFAIKVPTGDWTVKYERGQDDFRGVLDITVSPGRVITKAGKPFPSILINR